MRHSCIDHVLSRVDKHTTCACWYCVLLCEATRGENLTFFGGSMLLLVFVTRLRISVRRGKLLSVLLLGIP